MSPIQSPSTRSEPLEVVIMMRRPRYGTSYSVEHIAESIREHLAPHVHVKIVISRFLSNGLFRRLYCALEAAARQGDVNHVAGDVHFLTYFLNKRKTVLTVLDCHHLDGSMTLKRRLFKLLWFTIPVRRCEEITVISEAVKQDLLRHERIDPNKVHVIPVAVAQHYKHVPKAFNAETPTILQVGTSQNKNVPRLIEALAGVPCRLDIIGVLSDEYKSLLRQHKVDYRNYVSITSEEVLQRYIECDLVTFPSIFEGFGMPIIEANLVGRPIVTSNITSMPEVAGDAACLVDPYSVESIRAGILRVISDAAYRDSLVANGFRNALRYDAKTIAAQYEAVYRRLAQA